ncbi:unnamed protein product [Trichogramma brassicae]|uniref:Tetratricopeptide repeat protein 21A/21B C-terminal ARM domain-containing protein n=1 Tax=Trichogramma brassicae TaxID=86971 RepID=A0A6H5II90_9HYME|nr:unnamed protein product [Trichogramma brassicae]
MIVGTVAKENGDLEAAIKNLEQALAISRVKDHPSSTRLSTADQATLYLELISAYAALRRFAEASQMVEEARGKLATGPEYARIVVGHAELCVKMDDVERAIDMLNGIQPEDLLETFGANQLDILRFQEYFAEARGSNDILALEIRGKQLLLLAQVRERSGNIKGALSTLKEAKENQVRYVQRASLLPNLLDQKNVLADICFTMAEHMYSMRDYAQAVEHYKEALTYKPNDVKALLSLAKLYMQVLFLYFWSTAEIYTQSSKYDLASELLRRVIQHNATCVRAHEISGIIAEKEQNYKEAAKSYDLAWRYGGRQKLTIGYKLAYCNFKSKRFADAIEICNQVLKANPDYPRIKKDILEKTFVQLFKGIFRKRRYRLTEALAFFDHCKYLINGTPEAITICVT